MANEAEHSFGALKISAVVGDVMGLHIEDGTGSGKCAPGVFRILCGFARDIVVVTSARLVDSEQGSGCARGAVQVLRQTELDARSVARRAIVQPAEGG